MRKLIFVQILLCFLSVKSVIAQVSDSITYPDTSFYKFNIYKIDDGKVSKWGFYGKDSSELLTATVYDTILYRYRAGINLAFYEVKENGKYGFLKPDRSVWIPAEYDKLDYEQYMNPPRIFVQKAGKYGILNVDGSKWLEPVYDEIMTNGSEFKVRNAGKWGILNQEGKEIIPVCFEKIFEYKIPELSLVKSNSDKFLSGFLMSQKAENPCQPAEKSSV